VNGKKTGRHTSFKTILGCGKKKVVRVAKNDIREPTVGVALFDA
jgi:hypothetical protein